MASTDSNEEFYEDPQTGLLVWFPRGGPSSVAPLEVLARLKGAGFGDFFIDTAAIEDALLQVMQKNLDQDKRFAIGERRDGTVMVEFDDQKMTATLHITGAWAGKPTNLKQCALVLKAAHIAHGLDVSALHEIAKNAEKLAPGEQASKIVARGSAPVAGEDAKFVYLVSTLKDRIRSPNIRDDDSVDYRDLGELPWVHAGSPLVKKIPPGIGTSGITVTGESIPALPGNDIPFTLVAGVKISADDPNLLVAAIDGLPVLIENGMSVEKVLRVHTVNHTIGNINFEGAVVIDDDVTAGFAVSGDSDVNIGGMIDSARVVSGNDLFVKAGISGSIAAKDLSPSAYVTAGKLIWTPHAQFAELHANVGIIAMNLALHCKLSSMDWIMLGGEKPGRSKAIGGDIKAVNLIKVDVLGDPSEVKTRVRLFGAFGEYHQKHREISHQIHDHEQRRQEIEMALDRLRFKQNKDPQQAHNLASLSMQRTVTEQALEKSRRALATLETAHQEACKRIRLIITRKAYPGVEISIGDQHALLRQEWGPGTIFYGNVGLEFCPGEIQMPDLSNM